MFKLQTERQTWLTIKLPDPDGETRIKLRVKLLSHADNAATKHRAIADQIVRETVPPVQMAGCSARQEVSETPVTLSPRG